MAEYLSIDAAWIRIAWLTLLVLGPGIILYIVAWIAIPESDGQAGGRPARHTTARQSGQLIIGGLLVAIGGVLLANRYLPWMKDLILPSVLIAIGTGVVVYSLKK